MMSEARPPQATSFRVDNSQTLASLQGIAAQHVQSSEDDDSGSDPRITQGWNGLKFVADILKENASAMDPEDVKNLLKGLVS